jgi:hypothetical protein
VQYNPYQKQNDERFPEYNPEDAGDEKCYDDGSSDIYYCDVEDTVGVWTFSRTSEYIFITTEVKA